MFFREIKKVFCLSLSVMHFCCPLLYCSGEFIFDRSRESSLENKVSKNLESEPKEFNKQLLKLANFRVFGYPNCKKNIIFAGASPWCERGRKTFVISDLAKFYNVGFEVNLESDEDGFNFFGGKHIDFEKVKREHGDNYFLKLRQDKKYVAVAMGVNRSDSSYGENIVKALKGLLNYWNEKGQKQPVYVHCTEGQTRMGDFLSVLYLLAGAEIEYTFQKFLISFENSFDESAFVTSSFYKKMVERERSSFEDFLEIIGREAVSKSNALFAAKGENERVEIVKKYLMRFGMKDDEIKRLVDFIKDDTKISNAKIG